VNLAVPSLSHNRGLTGFRARVVGAADDVHSAVVIEIRDGDRRAPRQPLGDAGLGGCVVK
jgi:hypothetical protein